MSVRRSIETKPSPEVSVSRTSGIDTGGSIPQVREALTSGLTRKTLASSHPGLYPTCRLFPFLAPLRQPMSEPKTPNRTVDDPLPRAPAPPPETQSSAAEGNSATKAPLAAEAVEEDLHFLSPPQEPGELGRLGGYRILRVLGE